VCTGNILTLVYAAYYFSVIDSYIIGKRIPRRDAKKNLLLIILYKDNLKRKIVQGLNKNKSQYELSFILVTFYETQTVLPTARKQLSKADILIGTILVKLRAGSLLNTENVSIKRNFCYIFI
jgi:hypothetical protein